MHDLEDNNQETREGRAPLYRGFKSPGGSHRSLFSSSLPFPANEPLLSQSSYVCYLFRHFDRSLMFAK
ncbi:hypothetical protein Nepgr_011658 [Nepenthes gracilis]|uniref:Uncharacterized protein n=1 Tax=Nepenthes gracilis TaxID=150966 RepID=A0AAD3SET9_NEPGR|nr:hypothetical protein Nepgr_011658 [Nepenthes gracilis]